jgi:hypothetical protein
MTVQRGAPRAPRWLLFAVVIAVIAGIGAGMWIWSSIA